MCLCDVCVVFVYCSIIFSNFFFIRCIATCAELVEKDGEVRIINKMRRIASNKFVKYLGPCSGAEKNCLDEFLVKTDNQPLRCVRFFYFAFFTHHSHSHSSAIDWALAPDNERRDRGSFAVSFAEALGYNNQEAEMMASGLHESSSSDNELSDDGNEKHPLQTNKPTPGKNKGKKLVDDGMFLVCFFYFLFSPFLTFFFQIQLLTLDHRTRLRPAAHRMRNAAAELSRHRSHHQVCFLLLNIVFA